MYEVSKTIRHPMRESDFVSLVGTVLDADRDATADSRIREDLGCDSISIYEVFVIMDDMEIPVDEERWASALLVRDWYQMYLEAIQSPRAAMGHDIVG